LKHHVPTLVGVNEFAGSVYVAVFKVGFVVGLDTVPTAVPPEQPTPGVASWHTVKATEPRGGPPTALPVTTAESDQLLPITGWFGDCGKATVVAIVGVAGPTWKHSVALASDDGAYFPVWPE